MDRRSKSNSALELAYGTESYRIAMLNANRAYERDETTFPNYIRNDPAVKKALYLIKLDEKWKRKPK